MGRTIDGLLHNSELDLDGFSAKIHTIQVGNPIIKTEDIGLHGDIPEVTDGFQWIHLSVNNLGWAAVCFAKCDRRMDARITTMKMRPVFSQKAEANSTERISPVHARHLEPSCTLGSPPRSIPRIAMSVTSSSNEDTSSSEDVNWLPALSVYLPYMSCMRYSNHLSMNTGDDMSTEKAAPNLLNSSAKVMKELLRQKQRTAPGTRASNPLMMPSQPDAALTHITKSSSYPRRTLDQFYYPALDDTSARDADQTISKWTGKSFGRDGRASAAPDSALIMVDQLWCWVVDENTILTSFPSGVNNPSLPDVQDLYQSFRGSLWRDPGNYKSIWDIYSLLVRETTSYMFSQQNKNSQDLIEIYRWVTGKKAATQTTYFQEFQQGYASGGSDAAIFNDRRDLKLVLEVADIIDELKMIRHLLIVQEDVIKSSITALRTMNPSEEAKARQFDANLGLNDIDLVSKTLFEQARETLTSVLTEIHNINQDAEHTRKMLLNLLDLKSNAASLAEARSSAKEAQAATTQGRAVMLFTIITVIFLPLSFFTSYFGQNVKELTGDGKNPSTWDLWRVATPITIVVIMAALLVAYYITQPGSPLWIWKSSSDKETQATVEMQEPLTQKRSPWWKKNPFSSSRLLKSWNGNKKGIEDLEMTV